MKIRAGGGSFRAAGGNFRAAGCSPLLFLFMGNTSLGIFESDTVISDCPVQIFRKMMKYIKIKVYLTSLIFFLEILKENNNKKSSIKKNKKKALKMTS